MSIHPSLGSSGGNKKQRSVLKRTERLRVLLEKELWKEGDKVYGLPKIKTIRIRIKKEKAAEKTAVEGAAVEGTAGPAAAAAPAKDQAQGAKAGKASAKPEKKG